MLRNLKYKSTLGISKKMSLKKNKKQGSEKNRLLIKKESRNEGALC